MAHKLCSKLSCRSVSQSNRSEHETQRKWLLGSDDERRLRVILPHDSGPAKKPDRCRSLDARDKKKPDVRLPPANRQCYVIAVPDPGVIDTV